MRSMFATLLCIALSVTAVPATLTDGLEIAPDVYTIESADELGWTYVYWWLQAAIEGDEPAEPPVGPHFGECMSVRQSCQLLDDGTCRIYTSCITESPGEISLIYQDVECEGVDICADLEQPELSVPFGDDPESMAVAWKWSLDRALEWLIDVVEGDDPVYPEPFDCTGEDVWLYQECRPVAPDSDICEVDIICFPETEPGETGQGTRLTLYTVECANDPLCELHW